MTTILCRVYHVEQDSHSGIYLIPSKNPKKTDRHLLDCADYVAYLGEWKFDEDFLESLYKQIRPKLKLVAYMSG